MFRGVPTADLYQILDNVDIARRFPLQVTMGPRRTLSVMARMSSPQLDKFYAAELVVFSLPQHPLKMNVNVWTATVLGLWLGGPC